MASTAKCYNQELLNLELEGTYHRGVDDAWNIARILKEILTRIRGQINTEIQ